MHEWACTSACVCACVLQGACLLAACAGGHVEVVSLLLQPRPDMAGPPPRLDVVDQVRPGGQARPGRTGQAGPQGCILVLVIWLPGYASKQASFGAGVLQPHASTY